MFEEGTVLNGYEIRYRKTISAIGLSMLFFWGLINLFSVVYAFFNIILTSLSFDEALTAVIDQLFYGVGYLACFMLPVLLLKLLMQKSPYPYHPTRCEPSLTPWTLLILPAGIAVIFSAAYVNLGFVSIFDYSAFSAEFLWGSTDASTPAYALVLQFIVSCAVPGFCEEFLFRGAILTNLLPFGRSNAIFISAFLFGMMHQNPEQIFYAFAAGILLGLVYERAGNIWACTFLHIANNFVSVFEAFFAERLGSLGMTGTLIYEGIIMALGALALVILILCFFSKKPTYEDGVFGKTFPASDDYAQCPIVTERARKLFMTPSMVMFLIICVGQIILLLIGALLYGMLG